MSQCQVTDTMLIGGLLSHLGALEMVQRLITNTNLSPLKECGSQGKTHL